MDANDRIAVGALHFRRCIGWSHVFADCFGVTWLGIRFADTDSSLLLYSDQDLLIFV